MSGDKVPRDVIEIEVMRDDYAAKQEQLREALDALEAMTREWTWTEERSRLTSACKIECAKRALRVLAKHGRFTVERIPGVPEKPEDDVRGEWPENLPKREDAA